MQWTSEDPSDKMYLFELKSQDDPVIINNVVQTLGKAVYDQRQTDPTAGVAYHKIAEDTANPKNFTLSTTHRVAFALKEEGAESTQTANNIGLKCPFPMWNCGCLFIVWHVRWTLKGLVPVKPAVLLKASVTLAAAESLHCNKPAEAA